MSNYSSYPVPPSHRRFEFGPVVIDSNFDSGNCSNAEKIGNSSFNISIGGDNPENNYRTWFHFSVSGFIKGVTLTFKIKNMQNQSRLLNEGLVPVYRYESSNQWKRIQQKVNTAGIEYNQGWIQWQFRHLMTENEKVFFAFFYPWSNEQNSRFLDQIQEKLTARNQIYFHRTFIIKSWQGRPIQFLTLSSKKGMNNKEQKFEDQLLFPNAKRPKHFPEKKAIVLGARVHPGEVPGSHVMTGIIKALVGDQDQVAKILLDKFVFYIFPIFNPDGVARGHYRTDPNGTNLNRYYINPSPKKHSPIYACKKFIMHLHSQNRFFAYLDLHAHAARKGTFIYGNSMNELNLQVDTCIFPKILSMNSQDFQYEGSNFTEKNMYCKDRADKVSKEGAGRVAIYKATKNPYCWTLQCNYNMSRIHNILEPKKSYQDQTIKLDQDTFDPKLIVDYKNPSQRQAKEFFTIEIYHQLGRQICESFLDLVEANPYSRIQNPVNHYKSIKNLRMNLAVALLRMAPNRFQSNYKKIFYGLGTENQERCLRALYFLSIRKARIENMNAYIKDKNDQVVIMPEKQKKKNPEKRAQSLNVRRQLSSKPSLQYKNEYQTQKNIIRITKFLGAKGNDSRNNIRDEQQFLKGLSQRLMDNSGDNFESPENNEDALSIESGMEDDIKPEKNLSKVLKIKGLLDSSKQFARVVKLQPRDSRQEQRIKIDKIQERRSLIIDNKVNVSKVILQIDDYKAIEIDSLRNSLNQKHFNKNKLKMEVLNFKSRNNIRFRPQQLPSVTGNYSRPSLSIATLSQEPRLRRGISIKEPIDDLS